MTLAHSNLPPLAVLGPADQPAGSLQGYCRTTYDLLLVLLGEPNQAGGDKVHAEWAFRCNGGTVFTVYCWKEPSIPKGPYDWHIGGSSPCALAAFSRFTGLRVRPLHPIDDLRHSNVIVWDPTTGIELSLENAVVLDTDQLTDAEQMVLASGTQSDRIDLALGKGIELADLYLLTDDLS